MSLQRKRFITYFLPRRLGIDVVNSPMTSVLSTGSPRLLSESSSLDHYLEHYFSVKGTHLYGRCHMYFTDRSIREDSWNDRTGLRENLIEIRMCPQSVNSSLNFHWEFISLLQKLTSLLPTLLNSDSF